MDAMRQSRKMDIAAFCAWIWNLVLLIPHLVAINLAYPQLILTQGAFHNVLCESMCPTISSKQQDAMTVKRPAVHGTMKCCASAAGLPADRLKLNGFASGCLDTRRSASGEFMPVGSRVDAFT